MAPRTGATEVIAQFNMLLSRFDVAYSDPSFQPCACVKKPPTPSRKRAAIMDGNGLRPSPVSKRDLRTNAPAITGTIRSRRTLYIKSWTAVLIGAVYRSEEHTSE